jgi:predicted 3-demethylubiquinone-9 3-methyltransferase (glyoxalase superfamily)
MMSNKISQRITTFLWYDSQAEEAANFYVSIFKNSKVGLITRYGGTGPGPKGSVMTVGFTLDGQEFVALNGGPQFPFTEAISLMVNCESQEEIDYYWEKLSAGGSEVQCGWLKDKFGLSWQIVPARFFDLLRTASSEQFDRVMKAMMEMVKMDLAKLEQAYNEK